MLLPQPVESTEEDDPRAELIRRLQEYERFKQAAEAIDELPRMERELFQANAEPPLIEQKKVLPDLTLQELLHSFRDVLRRAEMFSHHHIQREPLSVRERMSIILSSLKPDTFVSFTDLFTVREGRMGVVVTFLAVLELIKESVIDVVQAEPFAPIYIKPSGAEPAATALSVTAEAEES
jgi:segregation and condensation protein A